MTKRQPYSYVLLRYRHDPIAGEFVNVGVVLFAPESHFGKAKVRRTLGRVSKVFPGVQKAEFTQALYGIQKAVNTIFSKIQNKDMFSKDFGDALKIINAALPADDSSFFAGPLCSGVAHDPEIALEAVYARFVSKYDDDSRAGRDDAAVWQPVKELLTARNLISKLQPKRITSPVDEVQFESAWKNGVWHCYQALSFDLDTSEGIRNKAARWSGHMTGLSKAEEKIRPYFIVGAPSHPDLNRDYSRAIDLLRASALNPLVYEESQSRELADLISDQIETIHDQ